MSVAPVAGAMRRVSMRPAVRSIVDFVSRRWRAQAVCSTSCEAVCAHVRDRCDSHAAAAMRGRCVTCTIVATRTRATIRCDRARGLASVLQHTSKHKKPSIRCETHKPAGRRSRGCLRDESLSGPVLKQFCRRRGKLAPVYAPGRHMNCTNRWPEATS